MDCPLLEHCFAVRLVRGGSDGELIGDESSEGGLKRGGGMYLDRFAIDSSPELNEATRLSNEMDVPLGVKRTSPETSISESLLKVWVAAEGGGVEGSA